MGFCNQKLSLKGCLTLETGIENDHKMTIFSKLKFYLSDRFPEFNFLGDVRSLPCDLTKEEILKLIENKSNNLKKYIYNLLESLNLDLEENHDKVIDIIHQHVENLLSLDELTSPELARFSLDKANPEIVKKQIVIAVDRILTTGSI